MWDVLAEGMKKALERGLSWDDAVSITTDAWSSTLAASGPLLADQLVRSAPKMLREHRRLRRGFQRRLRARWKDGLDLYYMVYVGSEEVGATFNNKHRPQAVIDNDVLFDVLTRLHARACRTAVEVYHLLTGGFAMGALARSRTLHEIAVTAMVLTEHGRQPGHQELAEKFALHESVAAYRDALQFQANADALGYEPFSDGEIEDMKQTSDELATRYGTNYRETYGWAASLVPHGKPKFKDLEALTNVAHLRPHYRWASHEVHSDSKGLSQNTLRRSGAEWQSTGPTNSGLADPGHMALISLHQTTVALLLCLESPEPSDLLALVGLQELVDRSGTAFLDAQRLLHEQEARLYPDEQV
jgi:hypothetical protein